MNREYCPEGARKDAKVIQVMDERIIHLPTDEFSPGLRAERDAMLAGIFPGSNDPRREWAAASDHYLLMRGDVLLGHVGVHRRVIVAGGRSFAVAGIVKVGVAATERGRGLGSRLMAFVGDDLRACGEDDLGLLVTGEDRLGFYGRLGWERIAGPVSYTERGVPKVETSPVLLLPLRMSRESLAPWYTDAVDLAGPFW